MSQIGKQTDRHLQVGRQKDWTKERLGDKQIDGRTVRQTNRQIDGERDGQTGRQRERKTDGRKEGKTGGEMD